MHQFVIQFQATKPTENVILTGDFDDWSQSVQLFRKDGDLFETQVLVKQPEIKFKFVCDGEWVCSGIDWH